MFGKGEGFGIVWRIDGMDFSLSEREVVEKGLHLARGGGVAGALGCGGAFFQACDGFVGAAKFSEGLGRHVVGRDVIGVVVDECSEFGESETGVALAALLHG